MYENAPVRGVFICFTFKRRLPPSISLFPDHCYLYPDSEFGFIDN